jgi:hypothetical protein
MSSNSVQLLNSELTERAREHRERELLKRIDARDREAMREFYLLYYDRLTRFLNRMTRRHELVDEMINDTLFVVWEKAGNFRGDSGRDADGIRHGQEAGPTLIHECRACHEGRPPRSQVRWGATGAGFTPRDTVPV